MTQKKTAPKPKSKKAAAPGVTLRQIEQAGPCAQEYFAFLRDLGCQPVPRGRYAALLKREEYRRALAPLRRGVPKYGPSEVIPFAAILAAKTSSDGQYFSGINRVNWLLARVDGMQPVARSVAARAEEIRADALFTAIREKFGA